MDKKIIKALFSEIAAKDNIRPLMVGVHFEKDRCYATDTQVLVVYNESDPRFVDKTIGPDGAEIKGKYPPIDRVIPKDEINLFKGNLPQLYRALVWWGRQKTNHAEDRVVIGNQTFVMSTLKRLLSMFNLTSELSVAKLWLNHEARAAKIISETFTAILMPCKPEEEDMIDAEREPETPVCVSYANLINTFALESSKPKEATPSSWDWL